MPELPDVEGQRRLLARSLPGRLVLDIEVADPRVVRNATPAAFERALVGRRFGSPLRHGKWLMLPTDGPTLVLHNGMTGRPYFEPEPGRPAEAHGISQPVDRLIVGVEGGRLHFADSRALGGAWIADRGADLAVITGAQGPDALDLSLAAFRTLLIGRRGAVKPTLIDQSVIAGIGNMLSDEICWRARLHPARPVSSLSDRDIQRLHRAMRFTTRTAAEYGAIPRIPTWLSSTRGREPAACPRCHAALRRTKFNGRTAIWCPRCQPAA